MVCSSTLSAIAVIHSAKRRKPRRVNEQAKAESRACQSDQVSVASVMVRLLCRAPWACQHATGSDQEAPLSGGVRMLGPQYTLSWKLLLMDTRSEERRVGKECRS